MTPEQNRATPLSQATTLRLSRPSSLALVAFFVTFICNLLYRRIDDFLEVGPEDLILGVFDIAEVVPL